MRQNKEIFDKYADKLLSAMKREGLMNIDVAAIFHVPPSYMTYMRKSPEKVPVRFMEMIRTWSISGKPLRGYQPKDEPDLEAAEMNQQEANETRDTEEFAGDVQMSVTPVDSYVYLFILRSKVNRTMFSGFCICRRIHSASTS